MKKLFVTFFLLFACTMMIIGAGFKSSPHTVTVSHTFLGGDSTNATYIDTTIYELPEDFSGYRFIKTFYQSPSIDSAALGGCTTWVDIQTGIDKYWNNIVTYTITDESTFTTTGYDLVKVASTDSILPHIRLRFRIQSDSDGVTGAGGFIDSVYTIISTFEVLARD